jgi:hypothetical protein
VNDTRLNQIAALVDDARCLISDMREEGVPAEDRIALQLIRKHLNNALDCTRSLRDKT